MCEAERDGSAQEKMEKQRWKKKEPRVRGEKKEKREMEGGKKARRQSRYYVCGDTAALV